MNRTGSRLVHAIVACAALAICITIVACEKKLAPTRPETRLSRSLASSPAGTGLLPGTPPPPGVVAGGFCTSGKGYFSNSLVAVQQIHQFLATGAVGSEILHVGDPATHALTWQRTGTSVSVTKGKQTISVDAGVAALRDALERGGAPGALSASQTNPTGMDAGGTLAAQALTLKLNQRFSEVFLTPATGFSALSLVDMEAVQLGGVPLTASQANALDGQATLEISDAVDAALGGGTVPYGLTIGQLTELLGLLNDAFASCVTSSFAQSHLYQPYVTSNVFTGKRPSTVSDFAIKPQYNAFSGTVVSVGTGCDASAYTTFPAGAIALIERGGCTFYQKVTAARAAGASAAIIFNSTEASGVCPATPTPGSARCEALIGMGRPTAGLPQLPIPAAFVQRSTGLLLREAPQPVTVTVQQ